MLISRKALSVAYGLIAALALVGTWGNNLAYFSSAAGQDFLRDTLANPASRSITVDVLFLGLAVSLWMLLEARRLGLRWVWVYIGLSLLIAISVTVPLFLIHRERALHARDPSSAAGKLGLWDIVGALAALLASTFYAGVTLLGA